jgi:hypothetical protein
MSFMMFLLRGCALTADTRRPACFGIERHPFPLHIGLIRNCGFQIEDFRTLSPDPESTI